MILERARGTTSLVVSQRLLNVARDLSGCSIANTLDVPIPGAINKSLESHPCPGGTMKVIPYLSFNKRLTAS
jgi:hypothetical protein